MFGKVAADVLGLSDVGAVIKPADYDKVDADDYIMHEDDEKIYFLIKSKADEYCFTNLGLVHVDGANAVSKKRLLRRYNYVANRVSSVYLETAGTVDLDVEIKFTLGTQTYSIDVHKKHLEELKDLYKALLKIAEMQQENEVNFGYAQQSLEMSANSIKNITKTQIDLAAEFEKVNAYAFDWLKKSSDTYRVKDFGAVFEKYINN
ncbi:PH domain-containing protein [Domibacillus sp. DTU_2020_1001157_1_SI_ALB_TIR_016]|uniref:PH domain-containing protein n=1 Tax=Domibacillus sp. DTU_2020_1001157_1_SI_ALB_TIR_016 TaxID=3077789 RepID=UPI0028EE97CA|nr:PH domain-containing protein [Domibacillus sp. DTU_2020_1001157_1_SI_ALB_TIR_016]WNS80428.1 PH domain-containing protein [Domibacillus sp. DTU_2020_1001157_1_SI_ALB_TIR_016]